MISRYISSSVSQTAAEKSHSDCSPAVLCSHHFPHVGSSDPATSDFARSVSWSNGKLTEEKKSFWSDSNLNQHPAPLLYHCIRCWGRRNSTSSRKITPFSSSPHSTGLRTNETTPKNMLLHTEQSIHEWMWGMSLQEAKNTNTGVTFFLGGAHKCWN